MTVQALLTLDEAAALLSVSRRTVERLIDAGYIVRQGGQLTPPARGPGSP